VVVRASGKKFPGQRNVLVREVEVYCANGEKKYWRVVLSIDFTIYASYIADFYQHRKREDNNLTLLSCDQFLNDF